jgi:hypothetical protein
VAGLTWHILHLDAPMYLKFWAIKALPAKKTRTAIDNIRFVNIANCF